jgi:hypothetical protein
MMTSDTFSCLASLNRLFGLPAAAFVLALLLPCFGPSAALGQSLATQPAQRSYVDPFPSGDRYRIVVLGDSLADGLWSGLYRAFEDDVTLEFMKRAKNSANLSRGDEANNELTTMLKDETYQVAVVMFGANDGQAIRKDGTVHKVGSDVWREVYGQRVETLIKKLRAANIAVYWVGLPVMRSPGQTSDAEAMNDVFREKAFINGAKFIDTWNGFVDEGGRYSPHGPDMGGQIKRLRADDGLHFTMRGYLKLAHFVEKELRKDLSLAKLERNIPLAGTPEEQAKVTGPAAGPAGGAPPEGATPAPEPSGPVAGEEGQAPDAAAAALQQNQVGEVSVLRPTISDTTLQAAQSLTPQAGPASMPDAEMIRSELASGLTAVATISLVTDPSLASSRPRLPLSQRPYYKVLIKGEQLKPKSGRGDDFAWPPG